MPKFQFTNKAVEDLTDIWNYTYDIWSENQADKYYLDILNKCREISKTQPKENPTKTFRNHSRVLELINT